MQTTPIKPFSLVQMMDALDLLRDYMLLGDTDTPTALRLLEQIRTYLRADEDIQQCMMEQYYRTVASYEEKLENIQQRKDN